MTVIINQIKDLPTLSFLQSFPPLQVQLACKNIMGCILLFVLASGPIHYFASPGIKIQILIIHIKECGTF